MQRSAARSGLVAALALLLSLCALSSVAGLSTSMKVEVHGSQILVNDKPFFIKGVIYSPSPIGFHPAWTWPHGDFFIPQYQDLWARDFPLLQALGANTIRISNWNNDLDHGFFLDQAHRAGLKVIVTFSLGGVWQSPVGEDWQQQEALGKFMWQFQRYLNHPALLGWTFGEQMNLPANGFLQAFAQKHQCGWNGGDYNADKVNGCFNNPDSKSNCAGSIACVYEPFFGWMNLAAVYAKNVMRQRAQEGGKGQAHLIIAAVSDVDVAWMRMNQFNFAAGAIDAWGLQIYRGRDFGQGKEDFFKAYESATSYNARGEKVGTPKPLIVVEYGIDAYNDPCGTGFDTPCYNEVLPAGPHAGGFGEDEDSQAEWGVALAQILTAHSSAHGRGSVAGGTINSWVDESWRCTQGVGGCSGPVPYPLPGFDASQCSWKAHVDCPQMNLWTRSLCGFWTPATFDHYSNVGWYGILKPSPVWGDVDNLKPRLIYGKLQQHWGSLKDSGRVRGNVAWIVLLLASLGAAALVAASVQGEYRKRSAQVAELEAKSGLLSSGAGRSPALHKRSPGAASGGSSRSGSSDGGERRSSRSIPAGRSSRATSGAGGAAAGGSAAGSSAATGAAGATGARSSASPDVYYGQSSSVSPLLHGSLPSPTVESPQGGRSAASEEAMRKAQR